MLLAVLPEKVLPLFFYVFKSTQQNAQQNTQHSTEINENGLKC